MGDYKLVFDAVYSPRKTTLLKEAEAAGAIIVSGVEMFLRQAIGQFNLFTGREGILKFSPLLSFTAFLKELAWWILFATESTGFRSIFYILWSSILNGPTHLNYEGLLSSCEQCGLKYANWSNDHLMDCIAYELPFDPPLELEWSTFVLKWHLTRPFSFHLSTYLGNFLTYRNSLAYWQYHHWSDPLSTSVSDDIGQECIKTVLLNHLLPGGD